MLPDQKSRGATLAKWAPIGALLLTAGITGSVLAATGTYHTAGIAALTLRNKLVAGKTYKANVVISHKEGVDVDVALSASNLTVPAMVTVPAGRTSYRFNVVAGNTLGSATLTASLNGTAKTKTVTVYATKIKDVSIAPSQITGGGADANGSVLLAEITTAPLSINLSTDDPRLATPATVHVNNGASRSNYFSVGAPDGVDNVVTANVTADVNGVGVSGPMTILPARIRFAKLGNEGTVKGGKQVLVVVELNGKAGPSGKSYSIDSSDPGVVSGGTLVVAPGAKSGKVKLNTTSVSSQHNVDLTIPGVPAMQVTVKP